MHVDAEGSINKDHLVVLWVGANEILFSVLERDPGVLTDAVDNIRQHIVDMVDLGAKHILVPNQIDPSGAPFFAADPALANAVGQAAAAFNLLLSQMLVALKTEYEGDVTIYPMDFALLGEEAFANGCFPADEAPYALALYLGVLASGEEPPAIDDPIFDGFAFWDTVHPTAAVHSYLAEFAYSEITSSEFEPCVGPED
jgi:phospholipase/lecithinase/hemolysin